MEEFYEKEAAFMQFNGYYDRTLDAKKRIVMPPKIRDMIGSKEFVVFAKPGEQFLRIYREEQWEEITNELLFVNDGVDRTKLQRTIFLNSENCEMDSQSRVVLPARFIEKAGIVRDIVIIGVGQRAEIWAKDRFDAMMREDDEPADFVVPF